MTSQIRVDEITNRSGLGTVTIYDNGFEFTGVTTFTENVDIEGNLTIGGVLTYEDTTNIDSVGVITARGGIRVTGDSIHVESSEDRLLYLKSTDANAYLTFEDTDSSSGFANRVGTVSDGLYFSTGGGGERLRITSDGKLGIKVTSPGCQTGGIHAVHDATEGTPSFTGGEVGIFQRNYNSAQGCEIGIIGGSNSSSRINFGDKDDADIGIISYSHNDNSMRFIASAAERLRITSGGHVNIGGEYSQTDSKVTIVDVSRPIAEATLNLQSSTTSGAADTGPVLRFYGHSGSEGRYHASIKGAKESGNVGSTAAYLAFNTRPSGGGAMAERLRISSIGHLITQGNNQGNPVGMELRNNNTNAYSHAQLALTSQNATTSKIWCDVPNAGMRLNYNGGTSVKINQSGNIVMASGSGIDFTSTSDTSASNASASSEILDDYEEGTWTPRFVNVNGSSANISAQPNNRVGTYCKIGNTVFFSCWITGSMTTTETTTSVRLSGLPYNSGSDGNRYSALTIWNYSAFQGYRDEIIVRNNTGNDQIIIQRYGGDLNFNDLNKSGMNFMVSGQYRV